MSDPQIRDEILERLDKLPPDVQERVLEYVRLQSGEPLPQGDPAELLRFRGLLDPQSAEEMRQAIEEGCEQIDADGW